IKCVHVYHFAGLSVTPRVSGHCNSDLAHCRWLMPLLNFNFIALTYSTRPRFGWKNFSFGRNKFKLVEKYFRGDKNVSAMPFITSKSLDVKE
ncbi:MAG: hypothetical protein IJU91_09770, partial [Selenomonadaceae bacterium]|nr:hypothetical protein [Selenomonadaceae bacterium]